MDRAAVLSSAMQIPGPRVGTHHRRSVTCPTSATAKASVHQIMPVPTRSADRPAATTAMSLRPATVKEHVLATVNGTKGSLAETQPIPCATGVTLVTAMACAKTTLRQPVRCVARATTPSVIPKRPVMVSDSVRKTWSRRRGRSAVISPHRSAIFRIAAMGPGRAPPTMRRHRSYVGKRAETSAMSPRLATAKGVAPWMALRR